MPKTLSLFSLLVISAIGSLAGQAVRMPAQTLAAIRLIREMPAPNRDVPLPSAFDVLPIYRQPQGYVIAVLCRVTPDFDKTQAIRDGIDVGTVIGDVATLRIPLSQLREDFTYPGIEYLEVAGNVGPDLHEAVKEIGADLVHQGKNLPQPYTGKDVIIGIVDWGFDYTHPVFYDTALTHSRILAAWDQMKIIGTPPAGFAHGALYASADDLAAAQHDTVSPFTDYHGTHVAGIAGGSGGGTIYRGVAFESDLLFSQMRNDLSSSIDAFQWMYNVAQAEGKRLVINNSWGNYRLFPLDGTSLVSRAIDAFSALGVVFVFSAGNNGDINFHLKKSFNQDSVRTRIMGFNYASDRELWGQSVGLWGEPGQPFSAQIRILDAQNQLLASSDVWSTATAAAYLDTVMITGMDTIEIHVTTDAAHPLNDRPQMTIDVRNKNATLKNILYLEGNAGTVHAWNTRLSIYGVGNWGYGFTAPTSGYMLGDRNFGVGHPGVTGSVITTAAHETNFTLTGFSSYGPRMDNVMKPDISAPGYQIVSSFNSFSASNFTPVVTTTFNGRDYDFIPLSGTSMSAPMVAGAVALLLEADPTLTAADVKQRLTDNARQDQLTGTLPPTGHVRWGHGKLDVFAAIQSLVSTSAHTPSGGSGFSVFPSPAKDVLYSDKPLLGTETYSLVGLDGRLVKTGPFPGFIFLRDVSPGFYVVQVRDGRDMWTFPISVSE